MDKEFSTKGTLRKERKKLRKEFGAPTKVFVGLKEPSYILWKTDKGHIKTIWNYEEKKGYLIYE